MNSAPFGLGGPLPLLLGIRAGHKVSIINPPRGFMQRLNPLPDGVEFLVTAQAGLDVILFFTQDAKELVERLPALSRAMAVTGGIWVCWPSDATGRPPVSEELIRQAALEIGLVDNKIAHLDALWTGLRLVWRPKGRLDKPERPRERPKDLPTAQASGPTKIHRAPLQARHRREKVPLFLDCCDATHHVGRRRVQEIFETGA
jgi:hypothetical protein